MAFVAFDIHVGQEIHFNLYLAVTLTCLTAAALDIKRKASRCVSAGLGFGQTGKEITDVGKHPRVCGRITARGAADGRLVNIDHFVNIFHAANNVVGAGFHFGIIQRTHHRRVQRIQQQR